MELWSYGVKTNACHAMARCFRAAGKLLPRRFHVGGKLLPRRFHVVAGLQPATICGRVCDPGSRTRSGSAGYKPATLFRRVANPPERNRYVDDTALLFSLFTFHSSLFTLHFSLFTFHPSLFTLHFSLFTFHSSLPSPPYTSASIPHSGRQSSRPGPRAPSL